MENSAQALVHKDNDHDISTLESNFFCGVSIQFKGLFWQRGAFSGIGNLVPCLYATRFKQLITSDRIILPGPLRPLLGDSFSFNLWYLRSRKTDLRSLYITLKDIEELVIFQGQKAHVL
jgi:hypothetical protein